MAQEGKPATGPSNPRSSPSSSPSNILPSILPTPPPPRRPLKPLRRRRRPHHPNPLPNPDPLILHVSLSTRRNDAFPRRRTIFNFPLSPFRSAPIPFSIFYFHFRPSALPS